MQVISNMKIRTLAIIVIAVVILSGGIFVGTSLLISERMDSSLHIWSKYKADTAPKAQAFTEIEKHIGYGGMIHQFKNLVLRKDKNRIQKFHVAAGSVMVAIEQYEHTNTNSAEQKALETIRETVRLYAQKISKIATLTEQGKSAREIDKTIKINDKAALQSLALLEKTFRGEDHEGSHQTKMVLVGDIRAALGYGGMIHQFKNYTLRQDAPRLKKVHHAMDEARELLKKYHESGTNQKEEKALADINTVITAYDKGLVKAKNLVSAGKTPEEIDSAIKISDGPALKGLSALTGIIGHEMSQEGEALSASLLAIDIIAHWVLIIAAFTAAFLIILVYIVLFRRIIRPIATITGAMSSLADGKLDIDLPPLHDNEIGAMAKAVAVFKGNAVEKIELEKQQQIIELKTEGEKRQTMQKLADKFDANVGGIIEIISSSSEELNITAQSMSSIAEEASNQAAAVATASEEASVNVQTVASSTEEMSSTISEINTQVTNASRVSKKAVEEVSSTAKQMTALAQTVNKIGEVVSLISDIAEQTNLLALNATIESARAGDAGKGFAVVASEVKALANETAKATESITQYIQEVQSATGDAVTSIDDIGKVIKSLEESSTAIAAAMEEQGATTQEVARNVQEAASGTQEVTSNITGVTEASRETGIAASQVTAASGELSKQAVSLKNEVTEFLQGLREGAADRRHTDDPDYKGPEQRSGLRKSA